LVRGNILLFAIMHLSDRWFSMYSIVDESRTEFNCITIWELVKLFENGEMARFLLFFVVAEIDELMVLKDNWNWESNLS